MGFTLNHTATPRFGPRRRGGPRAPRPATRPARRLRPRPAGGDSGATPEKNCDSHFHNDFKNCEKNVTLHKCGKYTPQLIFLIFWFKLFDYKKISKA